jgi:hypothetical protein
VALKYKPPAWAEAYLARAHWEACRVATALGVPAAYRPHEADGTLRVLEYPSAACEYEGVITGNGHWRCVTCGHKQMASPGGPSDRVCPALAPGAGTVEHTDPDIFSIVLWRSHPEDLEHVNEPQPAFNTCYARERLSPGLHIGEIGELVGLGPATPHRVPARPYVQKSLIYFAMPDHAAVLPAERCRTHWPFRCACIPDVTVGEWLRERMARSRY